MAEILITMAEGARHFRHFHVKPEDMAAYTEHMIMAALSLLKNPYVQNGDTETNHLQGKANNKTQSKQQMIAVKDII